MRRRLTVEAVVIAPGEQVLLVRQGRTRHEWELPGGKVEKAESLTAGLVREVREETGLRVRPRQLIGIFFIPFADEVYHNFVFACDLAGERRHKARPNPPEIAEAGFFPLDALPEPIHPYTRDRLREVKRGMAGLLQVTLSPREWVG